MSKNGLPHWAIKAARLWEREGHSDPGYKFLSGKMGGVRVLVIPNPGRHGTDDAPWLLCFGEHVDEKPLQLTKLAAEAA